VDVWRSNEESDNSHVWSCCTQSQQNAGFVLVVEANIIKPAVMEETVTAAATAVSADNDNSKPVLQHKYSMDATLKRSIPVAEAEAQVSVGTVITPIIQFCWRSIVANLAMA
jgi:hypothetical protein